VPADSPLTPWNETSLFNASLGLGGCLDFVAWCENMRRLKGLFPQLEALNIDDFSSNGATFTQGMLADMRAALGGAVALIPTFYYGNHGSFVLRTRPWLANATNGVLFYFRNDKRGDQPGGARGACGGRPPPHDCERTCLAGACAEASLPNLPDEVADFAAALPAGHPLHIGLYFSAYSHCPAPSPTYVRAALNASLSLPSVAGATVYVQQRPAGPWTPAFCAANPDDKGCIVRDVFGQFA
jgi:hypothetical protein